MASENRMNDCSVYLILWGTDQFIQRANWEEATSLVQTGIQWASTKSPSELDYQIQILFALTLIHVQLLSGMMGTFNMSEAFGAVSQQLAQLRSSSGSSRSTLLYLSLYHLMMQLCSLHRTGETVFLSQLLVDFRGLIEDLRRQSADSSLLKQTSARFEFSWISPAFLIGFHSLLKGIHEQNTDHMDRAMNLWNQSIDRLVQIQTRDPLIERLIFELHANIALSHLIRVIN